MPVTASVTAAREAYARGEWQAVVDALEQELVGLDTADLVLLGEATWWLGDSPSSMAVSEEVYQRRRRQRRLADRHDHPRHRPDPAAGGRDPGGGHRLR